MQRRPLVIMAVSFALVLMAGMAIAEVGAFAPTSDDREAVDDPATTTTAEEKPEAAFEPAAEGMEIPKEKAQDIGATSDTEKLSRPAEEPADTPRLEITQPGNGEHFADETLKFAGVTEPGARVFAGKYEADVLENGEWHIVLILSPGRNLVTFTARDEAGNTTTATVTAYLDAGEFTAHQKYGSCSEPVPFDKFYGTGTPGSSVKATSEYGSASTTVKESGEWVLEVVFNGAPYGKTFPVELRDSIGHEKVFVFTSYSKGEVEFSASQKYGVNTDPWEKFFGAATPGTVIEVMSEYGSARVVAEGYEWYLKVHFEGLAGPASFPIVLETSAGHRKVFEFRYQPAPIEFTANQKYGSCREPEPYDVFYGTARPGTTITITSDYGSAATVAGDFGKWDLKVFFLTAPPGVPFPVTVTDSEGHQKVFEFVAHAAG